MTNGPYIFAKLPVEVRSYVGTPRQCARMRYLDYWRSR